MFTMNFINLIMDAVFNGKEADLPSEYYLGLSITEPAEDGSNITEPNADAGYARVLLDSLSVSNLGVVSNGGIIDYGKTTGDWGRITHAVMFDGPNKDANMIWRSPLKSAQTISSGNTLIFSVGELYFTLANKAD